MADITLDIAANTVALDITQPTVSLELGIPAPTNIVRKTDTDVSGNSWVLDEDNFASDSATKVPTQQSVKAYADDNFQPILAEGPFADGDKTKLDNVPVAVSAEAFGAVGDDSTDNTTAIQAAIDYVAARIPTSTAGGYATSPAYVDFGPGIFQSDALVLKEFVICRGVSQSATELKAKNGLNADFIKSPDFDTLTGTDVCTPAEGVIHNCGFQDMRINGNASNQTAGDGIKLIAKNLQFNNVDIFNVYGTGLYTELGQQCPLNDWDIKAEGNINNLFIYECGGKGWEHYGPHDTHIQYAKIYLCDDYGFYCENNGADKNSTVDITHLHVYSCGGRGLHAKNVGIKAAFLRLENNYEEGLYLEDCENVSINFLSLLDNGRTSGNYQGVIDDASNYVGIANLRVRLSGRAACGGLYVGGTNHIISANISGDVTGGGWSTGIGLDLANSAVYCNIDAVINDFVGTGGILLRTGNTASVSWNRVNAVLQATSGTATLWHNVNSGFNNEFHINGNAVAGTTLFAGVGPRVGNGRENWVVSLRDASSGTVAYNTVALADTDRSHGLALACGSNLSAERTLTMIPGDANRTITLSGNPTLADWFNQSVKSTASPTFNALTITDKRTTIEGLGLWRTLDAGAVAVSHTGDTNETTLASVTIPANAIGPNGVVRVITTWSCTSSANVKQCVVRFGGTGGTAYTAQNLTTFSSARIFTEIANRNSASSQVGNAGNYQGIGASTLALNTSSVDTTSNVDLLIRGKCFDAADTITLESWSVEVRYQA